MNELTLIKIHNPFSRSDRDIQPVPYEHGRTLLDIRNEHFPLMAVTVSINGRVVPQEELALTWPMAGDQILFVPMVQGGDSNGLLRSVLMIVIAAVATYYLGSAGAQLTGAYYSVAVGACMIIGGMLVNALLPPPRPDAPGDIDVSQAYSWNPETTQRQGLPIPKFYGTNKLYGNIISTYLSNDGGSKQYINALIGLGRGPMQRLYDFKLNDQPSGSFQGVEISGRLGQLTQDVTAPFNDTHVEYPLSIKVVKPTPYIYTTLGSDFDKLEVEVAFPQGLFYANDSGGLTPLAVNLRVSVRKAGNAALPWRSITTQAGSVKTSAGGYWSLGKWSYGTSDDSAGGGGSAFSSDDWYEYAKGETNVYAHNEGDQWSPVYDGEYGSNLAWARWRWIGDPITIVDAIQDFVTITAAQATPVRRTFATEGLEHGQYEIKVENLSDDQTTMRYADDLYLAAVREVLYDDFQYPLLACVGIRALATDQLSGSLRFSCMAECSIVRRWTGAAWVYSASDNPAWVAWDILTKPVIDMQKSMALLAGYEYYDANSCMSFRVARYDGKDPSKLDLVAWKDWADWCDTLVPDGKGGTEKRITYNGGFDTRGSTWEAAQQAAMTGRANLVPVGDMITVAVDKPGSPVQMFTVGNIGLDSFKETFLRKADRASSLTIDFINRDKGYERDTFTVQLAALTGKNPASITLPGCTKESEAWRHGMYRLYNNLYISRAAELSVGIDAIACQKGDLVNIQHDVPQWGFGGRLVTAGASSVTLDQEVTIAPAKSYTVMVRLMNDTIVSRTVTNAPGTYTVLTVSSPFASIPVQYDLYAFGETSKVVKPFRVLNIRKNQDQECTLSLIEYNESVYNADTLQPALPTLNYSSLDTLPPVTNIVLDELLIARQDGTIDDVIDVYFKRPSNGAYYQAEIWYRTTGQWVQAGVTTGDQYRIYGVESKKTYVIAVVTVNAVGQKAKMQNAPKASIATMGKLAPPSDVTGFAAVQNGQFVNFSWTHIPDADLWGYEIRQGYAWEGGRVLASGISADQYSWQAELNGTYRFWIKAIDSSSIYSVNAVNSDITLTKIDENLNIIISQDEITKPGGPDGVKTNFVLVDATPDYMTMPHMLLDTDVPAYMDTTPDLTGYEGDITLTAQYVTLALDTTKIGETWTRILDSYDAFDRGATDQSYPARLDTDYPADTDTHITMPIAKNIYLSWSTDNVAYSPWELYLGTVQHAYRFLKIKYVVTVTSATGVFRLFNLALSLDVPDIEYIIKDFAVSAGTGNDILFSTYSLVFYSAPTVTAQLIGSTVNKVPNIVKNGTTGFHVDFYDKTDAKVAATADIRIKGY